MTRASSRSRGRARSSPARLEGGVETEPGGGLHRDRLAGDGAVRAEVGHGHRATLSHQRRETRRVEHESLSRFEAERLAVQENAPRAPEVDVAGDGSARAVLE